MLRRLLRNRAGSSTVDFAFALPVLVTLMLGMVQMGVSLHASGALRHAATEGVRLAKVDPDATETEVLTRVKSELAAMDADKITTLKFEHGTTNGADYGKVTVGYRVDPLIPLLPVPSINLSEEKQVWLPQ
ncbi:MAG: pilus assembly protein [Sphingomonadaceae bacterium]|nr:pilus assembly protein [Sphingomonadaceae bacterium]MCP5383598.1 pilus assembly protein [Altererythrobacter sp.]MCP5391573.1 pilus assembly protein [Sphingomonadaceae bacterium]MCP5394540.1 pilus assembly protein [Sphingomonadaceae bacterium]